MQLLIADVRNLVELCLGLEECNDEDFVYDMARALPPTIDIKTLLSLNDIRALGNVLQRVDRTLEKLCLIRCGITSDTFPLLCEAILKMPGCVSIDIA